MKRVLIYAPTVGRGGVHLVVRNLTHALATYADPDEWSFAVLGQRYDEIGLPVEWPEAWPFEQIDPVGKLPAHPDQFAFLMANVEVFVAHLRRAAKDYDVVYCPSVWWTMRSQQWDIGAPFVTTIPDFAFDQGVDMGLLAQHFRVVSLLVAHRAACVVFPTDFQRSHGETYYQMARTRTIYHSADFVADGFSPTPEEALRVRAKYGLPERYVLAFHCAYHKDPITILKAQHRARSRSPHVPPLVMAGIGTEHFLADIMPDIPSMQVRQTMWEIKASVGNDLFVLGTIPDEDVAGLHAGATCAVSASRSEGDIAGGTFNAFMARTPMIYSELPVYRERLGADGRYGYPFPVGDHVALSERIIEACERRDDAQQRALEAFGWAQQRTSRDVAKEYLDVFASV